MFHMSQKTRRVVSAVIIIILVVAMVLPMVLSVTGV